MESQTDQIGGNFYGVYLLCSESEESKHRGKCYIGFTVDPNRRINQHNRGKDFGGAKKTHNRGPWKMVMIVHGFPNNIAALQFEWTWQNPARSNRIKMYFKRKSPKESYFDYNFRILSRMLQVGPWYRLPLTVQWLENEYKQDFQSLPPLHMKILSGKIELPKRSTKSKANSDAIEISGQTCARECHLCMEKIESERSKIGCANNLCKLTCHIICLANHFISSDISNRGHYIPINGECPICETQLTWAEILQQKHRPNLSIDNEDYNCGFDDDEIYISD